MKKRKQERIVEAAIKEKLNESVRSILPIAGVVFALGMFLVPMDAGNFLLFLMGVVFLIIGLAVFTLGAEMSMQTLGSKIGKRLADSRKFWLMAFTSFVIGVIVTISEPDLTILANQVSQVPNMVLILTVSVGVGVFLALALLHTVFNVSLSLMLIVFYTAAFVLCFFVPGDFWSVAFDSGGVTTGPMTVPFIMAFGAGISSIKANGEDEENSFGLVSLCSIGPVLSVLILGICYNISGAVYEPEEIISVANTKEGFATYFAGFGGYLVEVARALLPILIFMLIFQIATHAFSSVQLFRIVIGAIYTFIGLSIFLTGANMGFMPIGHSIGMYLSEYRNGFWLIPVAMLIGYFIVSAEPAVHVLNKQVEQISAGAITAKTMNRSLAVGVSVALGLSMLRILSGIPILYVLIPGYVLALGLSFVVPPFFTGVAFDSGGVASGTMMSAFVLPMAIGACLGTEADIMTQAFGCVAFVALTPVISIQICGLVYRVKQKRAKYRFISVEESFIEYDRPDRMKKEEKGEMADGKEE